MAQTPKPSILPASEDYFLNDILFKICHQVSLLPETPGVGRTSPSWAGAKAAEGRLGGWLAGVPGRGGGRGARVGGGKAACREQPRAGRARRARAPAGAGRGREEPRAAAASAGGAAGPPHSPPAPPRSLALTPGRRRRAARAPPAPHGRPRHGALRPPRRCPALSSAPRRGKGEGARGALICKYLTIDYAKPQGSLASSPAGWGRLGGDPPPTLACPRRP